MRRKRITVAVAATIGLALSPVSIATSAASEQNASAETVFVETTEGDPSSTSIEESVYIEDVLSPVNRIITQQDAMLHLDPKVAYKLDGNNRSEKNSVFLGVITPQIAGHNDKTLSKSQRKTLDKYVNELNVQSGVQRLALSALDYRPNSFDGGVESDRAVELAVLLAGNQLVGKINKNVEKSELKDAREKIAQSLNAEIESKNIDPTLIKIVQRTALKIGLAQYGLANDGIKDFRSNAKKGLQDDKRGGTILAPGSAGTPASSTDYSDAGLIEIGVGVIDQYQDKASLADRNSKDSDRKKVKEVAQANFDKLTKKKGSTTRN